MSARQVVALGSAAVGALVALNGAISSNSNLPKSTMPGEPKRYAWTHGSVHYTVCGSGSPVVLVHGIGVAASSYEYRYIVEPLSRLHTVYALDLLGFGLSDHPKIPYTANVYIDLLSSFLKDVVAEAAAVVATGLSALYSAEVSAAAPELVRCMVLSSPDPPHARPELPLVVRGTTDALLSVPIIGQSVFHAMTARNAIRSYMRDRAYCNPSLVTESMVDAHYAMAHQPYARYAAQAYLAGRLSIDATLALTRVRQPLLLVVGADSKPDPMQCVAEYARLAPQTQVRVIDRCGILPHEEQAEQFSRIVNEELHAAEANRAGGRNVT
jgi:pimeloyl-ACP methyl ester carboxylesterase